ncbi:hypothetical protein TrVE_jg14433 [Triparma verrucosa]|uniref:Uncharacterized protein n=1 Tax=Triparma verrucosa TaxID=1606542 RepID=A0A9W7EXU5_9STRA|nr:hypothetical protein TrVE_jg14433 [Triparma verrucosa]
MPPPPPSTGKPAPPSGGKPQPPKPKTKKPKPPPPSTGKKPKPRPPPPRTGKPPPPPPSTTSSKKKKPPPKPSTRRPPPPPPATARSDTTDESDLPASNPTLKPAGTDRVKEQQATKGLSGADIVREDLKKQLREIQSSCDQLAKRKQVMQEKCKKHKQKIEKLKAPSEALQALESQKNSDLKEIARLSDELRKKNMVDPVTGDLMSDDQLMKRVTEIKQRKVKLKGLKEDKKFLVKAVIKLMGEEEVKHMIDKLDASKGLPEQMTKRIPRRASTIADDSFRKLNHFEKMYHERDDDGDKTWNFVHLYPTATASSRKRVIVISKKEKEAREKEEKEYQEYVEEQHTTIYRDNHSIIPLNNEGIDRNHLSTGLRRDFNSEHGLHPCAVSPVVAKERLVKRVPLWSSDVATNRTQMVYKKDKTGKLFGTHTPKANRGPLGRSLGSSPTARARTASEINEELNRIADGRGFNSPSASRIETQKLGYTSNTIKANASKALNDPRASPHIRTRGESEIEGELGLIDHGVAPVGPAARAKLGYTINTYDFTPYKEQTLEWAENDDFFNIEYKRQQQRIRDNLETQLNEVRKNVEYTEKEIAKFVPGMQHKQQYA